MVTLFAPELAFYIDGNNYDCIYDADGIKRVKYAYDKGHQVASHTWSHAHLPTLTWDQQHDEFWRVEPFGEYNDLVRQVADARGQTLVNWDFDSGDSVGKTAAQSMALYDQIAQSHPSTLLALNHEVYQQTAQVVLPHAIAKLQAAGYKLVTLAECLNLPAYKFVGQPEVNNGTWTC
ncbi:hypothetical protein DXG01_001383 [Tephrocybe rancida]|nr:hypothetical protein DXG01_001383 [Tephrocybe rancida]